jgi:hypothetical protein
LHPLHIVTGQRLAFPQRRLGCLARGNVSEQHGNLAVFGRPHAPCRHFDEPPSGHELALETHRLASAQHFAIKREPAVGLVGAMSRSVLPTMPAMPVWRSYPELAST